MHFGEILERIQERTGLKYPSRCIKKLPKTGSGSQDYFPASVNKGSVNNLADLYSVVNNNS